MSNCHRTPLQLKLLTFWQPANLSRKWKPAYLISSILDKMRVFVQGGEHHSVDAVSEKVRKTLKG